MIYNLMIVEDDFEIALNMKEYLEECGFRITIFSTITDATINLSINDYDLVLLDLNLPDFTGYELLKYLNKNNIKLPTIVISAYSDTKNKLEAFKLGADDYMVKPIDMEELEARIWIHLGKNSKINNKTTQEIFKQRDGSIFFENTRLNLTKTEYKIFEILLSNKNNLIKRETLQTTLSSKSSDETLNYHIKNIRKKINTINNTNEEYLITEYGIGYKLVF